MHAHLNHASIPELKKTYPDFKFQDAKKCCCEACVLSKDDFPFTNFKFDLIINIS